MTRSSNGPLKIGIGGGIGVGKTKLVESLCRSWRDRLSVAVITNDIYTQEDSEALVRAQALSSDRIIGVETGGCPHTAIREDATINLHAVEQLTEAHPDLDVILIESGGDNLAATFSPQLADFTIYVISVCQGDDIPRKGGLALTRSDILVVNKTDLAPYVNADLERMKQDAAVARNNRTVMFTDLMHGDGLAELVAEIESAGGLTNSLAIA